MKEVIQLDAKGWLDLIHKEAMDARKVWADRIRLIPILQAISGLSAGVMVGVIYLATNGRWSDAGRAAIIAAGVVFCLSFPVWLGFWNGKIKESDDYHRTRIDSIEAWIRAHEEQPEEDNSEQLYLHPDQAEPTRGAVYHLPANPSTLFRIANHLHNGGRWSGRQLAQFFSGDDDEALEFIYACNREKLSRQGKGNNFLLTEEGARFFTEGYFNPALLKQTVSTYTAPGDYTHTGAQEDQ